MSYQSNYTRGLWKCICESCGRIVKNTELRQRWDGFMVDERCWEPRQPQDFVRGVADYQAPPFTRPEPTDQFVAVCTPNGRTSLPKYATAGCALPNYTAPGFDPSINANDFN